MIWITLGNILLTGREAYHRDICYIIPFTLKVQNRHSIDTGSRLVVSWCVWVEREKRVTSNGYSVFWRVIKTFQNLVVVMVVQLC